jgi:hypothetical protein
VAGADAGARGRARGGFGGVGAGPPGGAGGGAGGGLGGLSVPNSPQGTVITPATATFTTTTLCGYRGIWGRSGRGVGGHWPSAAGLID